MIELPIFGLLDRHGGELSVRPASEVAPLCKRAIKLTEKVCCDYDFEPGRTPAAYQPIAQAIYHRKMPVSRQRSKRFANAATVDDANRAQISESSCLSLASQRMS
jgi:hypothetical protein